MSSELIASLTLGFSANERGEACPPYFVVIAAQVASHFLTRLALERGKKFVIIISKFYYISELWKLSFLLLDVAAWASLVPPSLLSPRRFCYSLELYGLEGSDFTFCLCRSSCDLSVKLPA